MYRSNLVPIRNYLPVWDNHNSINHNVSVVFTIFEMVPSHNANIVANSAVFYLK